LQLAKDLLDLVERAAVVANLRARSAAWQDPWHQAEVWVAAIERGETPNFRHFVD
jgi:hypothetical protein